MSSQDNRYDKTAPWKPRRNESNSSDSPERYRNRNDAKHYNYYKDRRYYDNRGWKDSPYVKRNSYDPNRYRYDSRKAESSDDKTDQNESERTEVLPTAERESTNVINKKRWNSGTSSPPKPKRPSWLLEQRPLETAYDPRSSAQSETNFSLIFNHINTVYSQSNPTQTDGPMSFIDRLIADEAMRMLAAASSNETTALNEPCDAAETEPANAAAAAVIEATETSSQQDTVKEGINIKAASKDASVSAADSKLLQKSAEQVTKKLLNQLSTMSKYDLKQMIDNPAGKYETALNRHAQNKLRAEVRKQLKSFGLNEIGSSCVTGDGTVESDEAIDADKIPSALLEQIEQVLDLNFFDVTQPELNKPHTEQASGGVEALLSSDEELDESIQNGEQAIVCTKSTVRSSPDATNVKSNTDNGSPITTSPKNGTDTKAATSAQKCKRKIIIRKPANAINHSRNTVVLPVKSNSLVARDTAVPFACVTNVAPIVSTMSKDSDTNGKLNSGEDTIPVPLEANSGTRNASFLRVSTVEELNRRLDGMRGTPSADNQPKARDAATVASERITSPGNDGTTSEMRRQTAACTKQNYRAVDISTVKVIGQSKITKQALLDYVTNKKDGKRIRIDHRPLPGGGELRTVAIEQPVTPNFGDDQSKTPVPQTVPDTVVSPVKFPARKGNSPKKRKFPKPKFSSSAVANASVSSTNDTTQIKTPVKVFVKANTLPPSTVKKGKKWKRKDKADRLKPLGSTEHSYCTSLVEDAPTPKSPEQLTNEDSILNTAYDEYINKTTDGPAPETAAQQPARKSHITIASVCSMSETAATQQSSATNDAINNVNGPSSQQHLPQDPLLMEPIDDSPGTSNHPDQHVQNAMISAVETESNLPDWCLAAEAINESKEGIARIDSSQPSADKSTEEYILGGDSEEKCVNTFIQTVSADSNTNNHPQENTQYSICNDSATPLPTSNMASLQSLCAITEHMQSIETQTMELYNRKMQIDAMFMTLQAERMDIDQQLKRLHNIRSEQINYIRLNLLELSSSSSNRSGGSTMQANQSFAATTSPVNQSGQSSGSSSSSSTQVGTRQQERTIRRITPIGGNSELMKIFQRRRVPSERSAEETSSVDQA